MGASGRALIFDPFCGVGGILIEAALIGLCAEGSDISTLALRKAKANLKHSKVKGVVLRHIDFVQVKGTFPLVVTDLPYGRNTMITTKNIEDIYLQFLSKLHDWHCKQAVIGLPDYIPLKKWLTQKKIRCLHEFSIYVHKSLTKTIFVLEP